MTYVPEYMPPQTIPGRGGLIAYGVISIIIGALAGCVSMAMPAMFLFSKTSAGNTQIQGMELSGIIVTFGIYFVVAVAFVWIGIGSCMCRRWVRPIILSLAWPWLVMGLLIMVVMTVMMIQMKAATGTQGMFLLPVLGITTIFYVGLPLSYVIFYQRQKVAETLAMCDPRTRWTDHCPIPVLGMSLWMALSALGMLSMLQLRVVPFFGILVTGAPAIAMILLSCVLLLYAAWSDYRLKISGWWLTVLLVMGWIVSSIMTFSRVGLGEFYRHSKLPEEQVDAMETMGEMTGLVIPIAVTGVIWLGYLLFVRRYFIAVPTAVDSSTTPSV